MQNIYWIGDVESTNSMSQEIGLVTVCHSMSLVITLSTRDCVTTFRLCLKIYVRNVAANEFPFSSSWSMELSMGAIDSLWSTLSSPILFKLSQTSSDIITSQLTVPGHKLLPPCMHILGTIQSTNYLSNQHKLYQTHILHKKWSLTLQRCKNFIFSSLQASLVFSKKKRLSSFKFIPTATHWQWC